MATSKGQRVGIWIIAVTMFAGTIGGFIAMMVAPGNEARDKAALEKAQNDYETSLAEMNKKYYGEFSQYLSRVGAFEASEVKELKTEDLKVGDGEEVKSDTKFAAYYIGWNPSGKIFDQSIEGETLKNAFDIEGLDHASVITGWTEGLVGMKIGGVRELTIPSSKAYGESGSGDDIPANTPLKFVVMAVKNPERPELLKKYYKEKYGIEF